jgi:hypothetical protein
MTLIERIFHHQELKDLREKVKAYESGNTLFLTSSERIILLNALCEPRYEAKVREPRTRFLIRQMYRKLKLKLAKKEVEMDTDFVKNIRGQQ